MKLQSKISLTLFALVCAGFLYSCDGIKDNAKTEIKAGTVSIDLDVPVDSTIAKTDENRFVARQTINLSDIKGLSEEALKHKDKIESLTIGNNTSITITVTDGPGTYVKRFKMSEMMSANSVKGDLQIVQYELGNTHIFSNSDKNLVERWLTNLFLNGSITLDILGYTDVPSGENLKVKITIDDLRLIAALL